MNCLEFRQLKLCDPNTEDAEANRHRDVCIACTQFEQEISGLDKSIHQALSVAVPEGLAARILLNRSLKQPQRKPTRWLWLSMAASFFAIVSVSYQFYQDTPLAEPVLAHINHKPHEFYGAEHRAIGNEQLQSVLDRFGIETNIENVVYAAVCPVDGDEVAHIVIKDGKDQYTVMLLPQYSPTKTYDIDDGMWRGYISPHPAGAIAVIADSNHTHAVARLKEVKGKYWSAFNLVAGI
ncbi:MAG: DUF3379 family protein [Pseudomonadales bacterium]|nr:DUF3379 family protein [Pseudomonadales bacterium]